MNEDPNKLIEEQFKKLPQNLQTALSTVPWKSTVKEIAVSHKLSLEQVEAIEMETMFILYGFENPTDYVDKLVSEVPLSEDVALSIAEQVEERVLKPISAKLQEDNKKEPVIITQETKEAEKQRLIEKREDMRGPTTDNQQPTTNNQNSILPEKALEIHPSVQGGEPTTYNLQPTTGTGIKIPGAPREKPSYQGGQDPYREPIE